MDYEPNNTQVALDAGAAAGSPRSPTINGALSIEDGIPYAVIPDGYKLESLEHLMTVPTRKTGTVSLSTTEAFIFYLQRHADLMSSTIYALIDAEKSVCKMTAVIDDNSAVTPGWRQHRAQFVPETSVEWRRWMSKNGAKMTQADFAKWLEDNLGDIAAVTGMPTGTQILAMALAFEANAEKRVKSMVNLQSGGIRFEFVDDETKETKSAMEVFQRFTLGLPVFERTGDAYPVEARLKYSNSGGTLTFWYELIRPDRAFKTAVQTCLTKIADETNLPVLHGAP